ncbi:hypothetical protein ABMA57_16110 [Saccharospirillum sp. HFRX-1]|uniref:hypothetical protein n=1 Tax=unclassified Saccharospirillum TaxID=2633430 RepID=UPI003719F74F
MKLTVVRFALAGLVSMTTIAVAQAVDWTEQPTQGTINLAVGFLPDPYVVALTAGGEHAASETHQSCSGFISNAPDVDLNYNAGSHSLSLYVDSNADTTLVVYDPDGNWHCSDDFASDSAGTNPGVVLSSPASGNYNIWIGTYAVGEYPDAELKISETQPVWDPSDDHPDSRADIEWGDNSSHWANDGECDDPRFAGPGAAANNTVSDRYHDANDCRMLYDQGEIYLR